MHCNSLYKKHQPGFTLIELMIVVAIVAVLATVAGIAYVRHIKSGRLVDARAFLAAIQARQTTFFQQHGVYCNASGETGASAVFHPPLQPGEPQAKQWDPSTFGGAATIGWQALGARPESQRTYMAVFVQASLPNADPALDHVLVGQAAGVGIPTQPTAADDAGVPATPHPWWYAVGHLDLDGSGGYASGGCAASGPEVLQTPSCTVLWVSSARGEIVVRNEGR